MAYQVDEIVKQENESVTREPIMVTIALNEYRSLIEENARLILDNTRLFDEKERLESECRRLLNGGERI